MAMALCVAAAENAEAPAATLARSRVRARSIGLVVGNHHILHVWMELGFVC
jgi:hypothetical protein